MIKKFILLVMILSGMTANEVQVVVSVPILGMIYPGIVDLTLKATKLRLYG